MREAHPIGNSERSTPVNGFDAERMALLRLREDNSIGDEVLRKMLRETDLRSRASEKSALPGRGGAKSVRDTRSATVLRLGVMDGQTIARCPLIRQ